MSRGAALVLAFDCCILLIFICRNLLTYLRSLCQVLPFDLNVKFHKLTAYSLLIFTILHVNGHYVNFYTIQTNNLLFEAIGLNAWQLHYQTWAGITGHLMLLIMFLMFTSSTKQTRNVNHEIFSGIHVLSFFFFISLFLHSRGCFVKNAAGICKGYNSNYFTIPAFAIYISEMIIRLYRSMKPTTLKNCAWHSDTQLELVIEKKSFTFRSGQYLTVKVPAISWFEAHPFTVSSCSEDEFITIHVGVVGNWTRSLSTLLRSSNVYPRIIIDGPYGAPSQDLDMFKVSVLICAGLGNSSYNFQE